MVVSAIGCSRPSDMDKWTTLEPVKLHGPPGVSSKKPTSTPAQRHQYIGPLPVDIHVLILNFLPITSLPSYARASRALARLTHDERVWKRKCDALGLQKPTVAALLSKLESQIDVNDSSSNAPPVLHVSEEEDDFGDFTSASLSSALDMNAHEHANGIFRPSPPSVSFDPSKPSLRTIYVRAHRLLLTLSRRLSVSPHLVLTELFPPPSPTLLHQSQTLRLLSRFLSPTIAPTSSWQDKWAILASTIDRFQAVMLATFEAAETRADEQTMTEAAWASWECWDSNQSGGEWELGRVWAEKLEIFYEGGQWDPLQNFT